jgi:pyruvate formate lyase activating enzyme
MKIGGLQKVSLSDYPGRISAILFTQGCNFRCPYCHNPELVDPSRFSETIPETEILSFLERRRGKIDAVTITGGEPTLQPDLLPFIGNIREYGYLIKLDTNGSRPDVIGNILDAGYVDYIAMDIKAPPVKYPAITHSEIDPETIRRSISLIVASGIDYEFRTTVVQSLLNASDIAGITGMIKGAQRYVLQAFAPTKALDQRLLQEAPSSREELTRIAKGIEKDVYCILVR